MSQTVRPVITSGTVAQGGILISAVNGTAFIDVDTSKTGGADFSAALLAAVANNDVIEITSATSKQKLIGFAKAAGSGTLGTDNLGSEKFSYGDFSESPGWVQGVGWTIGGGVITGVTASSYTYRQPTLTDKWLCKVEIPVVSRTAGTVKGYINATPIFGTDVDSGSSIGYATVIGDEAGFKGTGFSGTIDNVSLKQLTAPSATGVTITNSPGGATYNFGLLPTSTTFYNDASGYTYRILSSSAYGKLIATQAPVSGTLHIATVDGGAMFFADGLDFSSYAGNDTDTTKYLFVFYDSTGKSAQAYAGAVGGGKTLGAEINTGTLTLNTLYEITATEVNHFGTGLEVGEFFTSAGTETCDANNKVKAFTDIVATGLHLLSTKNGSTRNMKSVESGFNANAITRVNIYRAL
jgi:hypothetical protein